MKKHLPFSTIFLLFSIFCACKSDTPPATARVVERSMAIDTGNSDDARIRNLFTAIKGYGISSLPDSTDVFIIQSNKCPSCNKESFKQIKEIEIKDNRKLLFLITTPDEELEKFFTVNFKEHKPQIVIDTLGYLPKYGLGFMKNIFIVAYKKDIISWRFI